MGHRNYTKLGRRWRRVRGFRLNCMRFSVHRLRVKIIAILRLFSKCFRLLSKKKDSSRPGKWPQGSDLSSSRRGLMLDRRHVDSQSDCRIRACTRSNSFYAEAIADCLEFIKRNSVSIDDYDRDRASSIER